MLGEEIRAVLRPGITDKEIVEMCPRTRRWCRTEARKRQER
jgi:hypothetical protein